MFRQRGCILAKVVVIGQTDCIQTKGLFSQKRGCIRANVFVFGKVVVFGQKWL